MDFGWRSALTIFQNLGLAAVARIWNREMLIATQRKIFYTHRDCAKKQGKGFPCSSTSYMENHSPHSFGPLIPRDSIVHTAQRGLTGRSVRTVLFSCCSKVRQLEHLSPGEIPTKSFSEASK